MNEPIRDDAIDRRLNQRAVGLLSGAPAWIGTIALVGGVIYGGGVLHSRVEATEILSKDSAKDIVMLKEQQERIDKDIAVRLKSIEVHLEYLVERRK